MDSPKSNRQNTSNKNNNQEIKVNKFMDQNNMMNNNQEGMINLMMD